MNLTTTTATTAATVQEATTSTAVKAYLTSADVRDSSRNAYKRELRQFTSWLTETGRTLDSLTVSDVIEYKQTLLNKGLAPRTVAAYLGAARKLCGWLAAATGTVSPASTVRAPKIKKQFAKMHLTGDQARALEVAAMTQSKRNGAIVALMLHTGLRCVEVVRANVEDLTYKGGRRVLMVMGKGKDAKDDFVIISPKLYGILDEYLSSRNAKKGEPLFVSESDRNNGGRLTTRTVSGIAKTALRAIHLNDAMYTAHSLRHTTAVALLTRTKDITAAQEVLRHANIATTQIYTESIREQRRLERANEYALDEIF